MLWLLSWFLKFDEILRDKDKTNQLHREIRVFQNFIEMRYVETLKNNLETFVDWIRMKIHQEVEDCRRLMTHSRQDFIALIYSFSLLLNNLIFDLSSSSSNLELMLKKTSSFLSDRDCLKKKIFILVAAFKYEINQRTISNRLRLLANQSHDVH